MLAEAKPHPLAVQDLFGESIAPAASGALKQRFVMPPFSVLNARDGEWQDRKRQWRALGLDGDDGTRDGGQAISDDAPRRMAKYNGITEVNARLGAGTSIFDPVLCEVMYGWFCPPYGHIMDPFAGEATKGIVAGMLGYQYTGAELRQAQVDANRAQARAIGVCPEPRWVVRDSAQLTIMDDGIGGLFDFVWTSPPYYDLEVYTKGDSADGSAFATYESFMVWYKTIFAAATYSLRPNRFLAVKVGEIRDERGVYRNFVADNIRVFRELGLHYYNEIILVTAVGSAAIRAGNQFSAGRKISKTHQNILVFYKGDLRRIKHEFPPA